MAAHSMFLQIEMGSLVGCRQGIFEWDDDDQQQQSKREIRVIRARSDQEISEKVHKTRTNTLSQFCYSYDSLNFIDHLECAVLRTQQMTRE